jgi:hypothetical protein
MPSQTFGKFDSEKRLIPRGWVAEAITSILPEIVLFLKELTSNQIPKVRPAVGVATLILPLFTGFKNATNPNYDFAPAVRTAQLQR